MLDAIGTTALFRNGRMWPYPYWMLKHLWLTDKEKKKNRFYCQDTWHLNRERVAGRFPNHDVKIKSAEIRDPTEKEGIISQAVYAKPKINEPDNRLIVYSPGNGCRMNDSLVFAKGMQESTKKTNITYSIADYSMYLAQRRLKNRAISQEDTAEYFKELVRRAFEEETPNDEPLVFVCDSAGGVGELHGLAAYLDEKKRKNGGKELPDDIQAKVNKMKIVTVNVPSKAEHQGDALLYSSLRSFYARFLFSEKFREFNTATACERILSHITINHSQNILIMQVNDDPVVSPELQLFNKVDPLIASTRKDQKNVINRVMFRVINEVIILQNGTFKNVNKLVHHNVPWQYWRLWNRNGCEERNPYHVINDFIYKDEVPNQKVHDKSEKKHREDDKSEKKHREDDKSEKKHREDNNREEADQITRTSESIGKGIFNLLFFLLFLPVIPGGYLVNLLNRYHALQTRHPKRAMLFAILFTLAVAGLIVANIFMPFAPLIPLIIGIGIAWLVSGPFDVIANWFNKKIRHANIDMGILPRILRIAFVLYNLCITGLLVGVVKSLVKGAVKISSVLTVIGAAIGTPIISIAKFIAARPILRYTITALLLGLAIATPFLAPVIFPALGLTALPMKIALGLSYATTLLPPLFPEKLWQACKQHKYIAIVMVLLLVASIAVPFVGIGTGALFGAALLSKLAAVVISAASSLLISWIGLKIADCSPCCNIESKKENDSEFLNSHRKNSCNKIYNGLDYYSPHNRNNVSNIDSDEDNSIQYAMNHNNIHKTSTDLLYDSNNDADKDIEHSNGHSASL